LYSNLHIGLCVAAYTIYSFILLKVEVCWDYVLFVSFATSFLYATHRLIGIDLVGKYKFTGRFGIIFNFRKLLLILAFISGILTWVYFFRLSGNVQLSMVAPGIISLLYVLPFFNKKRLRDFPLIKIFLIAIVYTYNCQFIPGLASNSFLPSLLLFCLSRMLFVFAITVPFDIRDYQVDKETSVPTLVSKLGLTVSKGLAIGLVILSMTIVSTYILLYVMDPILIIIEGIVHLFALLLISFSSQERPDIYFSLYLDGCMGLFLIIYTIL